MPSARDPPNEVAISTQYDDKTRLRLLVSYNVILILVFLVYTHLHLTTMDNKPHGGVLKVSLHTPNVDALI